MTNDHRPWAENVPHHYLVRRRILQLIAAALAVAAGIVLLILPLYSTETTTSAGTASGTATLLEVVGPRFLGITAIPVVLTLIPLAVRGKAWLPVSAVATLLLTAFTVLGILTIGIFYIPATILAMIATITPDRHRNTGRIIP